jgi:16S rRNA (guanine(966)-N(2))-methyltransferase RsmD
MRITGGLYLNRKVFCPKGIIRPAMDRMRESMFSILRDLEGLSFLDLFTGSGCIGIEAASRGAAPVHVVEMDHGKKDTILKNLAMVDSDIKLFIQPAEKYISRCVVVYDIIHLDPPFDMPCKGELIKAISDKGILKKEGRLMMHYPDEESYPEQIGNFVKTDLRKYGRSMLVFYTFA